MLDSRILGRLVKQSRASDTAPESATLSAVSDLQKTSGSVVENRADVYSVIARSGLFDPEYYKTAGPTIEGTEAELLDHFLDVGYDLNRRPNPYFEPFWYAQKYPDVTAAGMHCLYHYVLFGDREGRWPGPLFNTPWYRSVHNIPDDAIALAHYLEERRKGSVSPLPEFDISFYAKSNPDVIAAKVDPFEHFASYGFREGRNPSSDFDVMWYAREYLSGSLDENPFFHWLSHKGQPGFYGRMPDDRPTIAREVRRFTSPAPEFEELQPLPNTATRKAKVLAYYLPQFHTFKENDAWWGAGFTEWTNIPRGIPRFKDHFQPRVPRDLGFYKLDKDSVAETLRRQSIMAQKAGIHGFVFYHYWFNGKRLMPGPLEYLLSDPSIDLPFCLMWANENWTRRWDGAESEVLISQDYREDDDEAMVADFARHFSDPRYIRVDKRPLLMVYRPGIIPNAKGKIERWRSLFSSKFRENPVMVMAQAFGNIDPTQFGLDGAIEFPPHKLTQDMPPINHELHILDPEFTAKTYRYEDVMKLSVTEAEPKFPLIKTVVPSWDNDARRQGSGLVITGSTPALYESWLRKLVERAIRVPFFGEAMVCVNAWNEWCEGAYLEPDLHFGAAYLNATGRAVAGLSRNAAQSTGRLLLVGHDAFPGGAQTLLLKIGEYLLRNHGVPYEYLLLDGGRLVPEYKSQAPTTVLEGGAGLDAAVAEFVGRGFTNAIVNTTAAGYAVTALSNLGNKPILLVHELPRLLREKNLLDAARRGLKDARVAIFPANYVRDAIFNELGLEMSDTVEALIIPQGLYSRIEPSEEKGKEFRHELGIEELEPIVLGIGYADLRKGFDIFLQLWRQLNQKRRVHFCWLGNMDPGLNRWLAEEIRCARATGTFHMPGQVTDVTSALSASSVFALTSREDPFPTVALEGLASGLPIVAFTGSGGIPEMLIKEGVGYTVEYGNVGAMSENLMQAIETDDMLAAAKRRSLVSNNFSFSTYVNKLLHLAMPHLAKVSVAVPNFNYARYMPERLGSIFRQSYPIHEVLVLDDCSVDDSVTVIQKVADDWDRKVALIENAVNSGSVFAQWRRATETATGDWIWIAEADDSSEPEFLSQVLSTIQQDPLVALAFTDSRTILEDGSPQWGSYKEYYATIEPKALCETKIFDAVEFVSRFLSVKNVILNVSAVVWKREALLRALNVVEERLQNFRMAGDWLLYLEALSVPGVRLAYVSMPLNIHRRHSGSVTHRLATQHHVQEIKACQEFVHAAYPIVSDSLKVTQMKYLSEVRDQFAEAPKSGASRRAKKAKR